MKKIGAIKLYYLLNPKIKEAKIKIGRDRFINILRENGLMIKRKRRRFVTTNSNHWMKKYDNLIEDLIPSRPEELYVADITYFETQEEGAVYGHFVTDAYSKKIMGFEVSLDLKAASSLLALKMAIDNRVNDEQLIHHSDRGTQYCSSRYVKLLKKEKIKISMTQDGNPTDNPIAERINGILKQEFVCEDILKNIMHAKECIAEAVEIYNDERPHMSNHMLTPNQMHQQRKLKIKKWGKKKE